MSTHRSILWILAAVTLGFGPPSIAAAATLRPVVLDAYVGHVKRDGEKQLCHPRRFPRREPLEVNRVEMRLHGESHHVHLYRAVGDPEYPPHNCPFAVDFSKWALVAATQNEALDWQLHPGVSILFEPHQPLLIQTHFNNDNPDAPEARGAASARVVLHPADPATVTAHGGALFAQDRTVRVPPGRTTATSRCMVAGEGAAARDLTIMALTGHYHYRGTEFEVYRVNVDGSLGERVYDHQGYDDPPFQQYPADSPLVLHAGEGIEWRCTYQNNDPMTYEFGPNTKKNEHCNLFGFYYPAESPQETIDCVHTCNHTEIIVAK